MRRVRLPRWTSLLLLDEVSVTVGAQFREVALAALMLALWPSPKSYALAILATLLPSAVCGRWVGTLADRWPPKLVLMASYLVRAGALVVVARSPSVGVVLAALVVLAFGSAAYTGGMSHYQALGPGPSTQTLLGRLRIANSTVRLVIPLVAAGALLTRFGVGLGFWLGVGCYGLACVAMAGLPTGRFGPDPVVTSRGTTPRLSWPASFQARARIVAALNGLMWIANVLYSAYILVNLRAGPVGFAISYALWGGSGLLAGWLLQRVGRIETKRFTTLVTLGSLLITAGAWGLMTQPLPFWPVALLGAGEGMATWFGLDTLETEMLALAPAAQRGAWRGQLHSTISRGRVMGLAAAILLPVFQHVHQGFLWIAMGSLLLAGLALIPLGTGLVEGVRRGSRERAHWGRRRPFREADGLGPHERGLSLICQAGSPFAAYGGEEWRIRASCNLPPASIRRNGIALRHAVGKVGGCVGGNAPILHQPLGDLAPDRSGHLCSVYAAFGMVEHDQHGESRVRHGTIPRVRRDVVGVGGNAVNHLLRGAGFAGPGVARYLCRDPGSVSHFALHHDVQLMGDKRGDGVSFNHGLEAGDDGAGRAQDRLSNAGLVQRAAVGYGAYHGDLLEWRDRHPLAKGDSG